MTRMRAVTAAAPGGPEVLGWGEVPAPEPGPGEVLVDVVASAVNRADLLQRQGFYPPPPGASDVLGLECSGRVAALGPGTQGWAVGDECVALLAGGGYAEQVAVPAGQLMRVPRGVDLVTAAALPEVACTVWSNVVLLARLRAGETLLVHGVNSGIGVTAVQMAKAAGAHVFATARGAGKAAQAREIGADVAVDATAGDWAAAVKSAGAVDVVLDMVGAEYFARNLDVLAPDGRLVVIAFLTGATTELNLMALMMKRLTVTGSTLRARDADEKARLAHAVEERVWPWLASGAVKIPVDRVFPLERAGEAHAYLERGAQFGKVVLSVAA
jgi:putative PIG3 family NAD(P)H quinone oxidoreductase